MSEMQVLGGSWQFENDERVFQGTLHFNVEDRFIALNLLIPAEDNDFPCAPYTGKIPFITGKLFTGTNIVLFDCITGKEETVLCSHASQVIYVKYAFWGLHVNAIDELVFKEVSVDFGDILNWYDLCRYTREYSDDYKKESIIWEHDEPVNYDCNDNLSIHFLPRCSDSNDLYATSLELKQSVVVSFQYRNDVSWNQVLDDIQVIQYLISLGTTQRIEIETAKYQHRSLYQEFPGAEPEKLYHDCDILFGTGKVDHTSKKYPFQYLFQLKELTEINGLTNWYKNFDKLQPILDLYNIAYTNNATVVSMFLNLTQALETFHARFYANTWGIYKERVFQKLSTFDEDNPNKAYWEKLLLGTDPNCKKLKLKFRLFDLCFDLVLAFLSAGIQLSEFFEKSADTRNYYTHYDEGKKDKCFDRAFLPTANSILMGLLEYHLMLILGFDQRTAEDKARKEIADTMMAYRMRSQTIKVNSPV